jgi:hypothetical protein
VTVTATDVTGPAQSASFIWTITAGSTPTEIGDLAPIPGDAQPGDLFAAPDGRYLQTFTVNSGTGLPVTTYLAWLDPADPTPTVGLSIPGDAGTAYGGHGVTFGSGGEAYVVLAGPSPEIAGRLIRWDPGASQGTVLHTWPNDGLNPPIPVGVAYLDGSLYVDAPDGENYALGTQLMRVAPDGTVLAVREQAFGGLIDAGGGQLTVYGGDGYQSINQVDYLNPSDLSETSSTNFSAAEQSTQFDAGPDGSWVTAEGPSTACSDLTIERISPSGVNFSESLTSFLGIGATDSCSQTDPTTTSDGRVAVLATDSEGLVLATSSGASITRQVVGPADALLPTLAADGSGQVMVAYDTTVPCSGQTQQCSEVHLLLVTNSGVQPIAVLGGQAGDSVVPRNAGEFLHIADGSVAVRTLTTNSDCGVNCVEDGAVEGVSIVAAPVVRQGWHSPG